MPLTRFSNGLGQCLDATGRSSLQAAPDAEPNFGYFGVRQLVGVNFRHVLPVHVCTHRNTWHLAGGQ